MADSRSFKIPDSLNKISMADNADIVFAFGIFGILVVLLIPIPTFILDFLFGLSVTFSILILMTVVFISTILEFSSFPSVLLITALFRLSLNIASTRLILSEGHKGTAAAGNVIEAFGHFVMSGSVIIGIIVFFILTIINFIVITKGSGRIAEVAARFSLDSMPGKQMAVDADLSAGIINESEAKERRKTLESESAFFGAMDGASKFVRGDAIAGLIITMINFVGGMIIGIIERGLSFSEALESYTILTIGDGLISQIPALIVSISAGLLVSRNSSSTGSADKDVFFQLGNYPKAIGMVSFIVFAMALLPSIPFLTFLMISVFVGAFAWRRYSQLEGISAAKKEVEVAKKADAKEKDNSLSSALKVDSIRIELGYSLLPMVTYNKSTKLPDQVKALRMQFAKDMGFIIPSVRIQDNMLLESEEYVIKIKDIECGRGNIRANMLMVMNPSGVNIDINGEETKEPTFGLPAKWISESDKEKAAFKNYTVITPPTVITTHLTEIIKNNIVELLSYVETSKLLDTLDEDHKKLLNNMIPDKITISGIQNILRSLLAEGVSIRDLSTILESVSEIASSVKDTATIVEAVRKSLARQITYSNISEDGTLEVLTLSSGWESVFTEGIKGQGDKKQFFVSPGKIQEFILKFKKVYKTYELQAKEPVILVNSLLRPYVYFIIKKSGINKMVLSDSEVYSEVRIKVLGEI